jgi:WD40 repeat protein
MFPKRARTIAALSMTILLYARLQPSLRADEPAAPAVIPFEEVGDIEGAIVFDKHVFPIMAEKCMTCHDAEGGLAEGDLDVLTVEALRTGGKKGPAFVAGKGAESLIVQLASHAAKPIMPPKAETPLTPRELSILRLWIDQGAQPGDDLNPAASLMEKEVLLSPLPPGVHPVYALDLDAAGTTLVAGRANQVFVYDLPSGGLRAQLTGHQDIVQSVRLSPDGKWIAAGGYQVVKLWQVPHGKEKQTFAGHASPVKSVAVNAAAGLAVTASEDQTVRLWSLASGAQLRQMGGHGGPIHQLAMSAECSLIATACADKLARLFDTASGRLIATLAGHTDEVQSVTFSPDRQWLVTGSKDMTVRVWSIEKLLHPEEGKAPEPTFVLQGHAKPINRVVATKSSVLSAADDGLIYVWNLSDGAKVREMAHGAAVFGFGISSDETSVASGGADNSVKIWSLADGALKATFTGHLQPVTSIAFSPDGSALAGAGMDGHIRVWDLAKGQLLYTLAGHGGAVFGLVFGADSKTLVSASMDKTVKVWEAAGGWGDSIDLGPVNERALALAFSPDSKKLAIGSGVPSASGDITIWDIEKREEILKLDHPHSDTIFGLAFSPDGKLLASGAADKFLKVHEVETGKPAKSFEGHTHHVLGVGWKGDGKVLATSSADNSVKLWSYETGEQITTIGGHGKHVTGITWIGPSGVMATSCGDRVARFVGEDGKVAKTFGGATEYLYCVAASADSKTIVAGAQDGKIFIWNGADGKLLQTLDVPKELTTAGQ